MTEQLPITPSKIIAQLEITPITLRRWCAYHKAHLSPGANPGEGVTRHFIGRDLEVFKHVRSLRDQGLNTEQINEQLAEFMFPEIEEQDALTVPPSLQEGPREVQAEMRPRWWFVAGVGVGAAVVAELFAMIASRGH